MRRRAVSSATRLSRSASVVAFSSLSTICNRTYSHPSIKAGCCTTYFKSKPSRLRSIATLTSDVLVSHGLTCLLHTPPRTERRFWRLRPEPVRRSSGVVGEVLRDAVGVGSALRHERSRDGGDREEEQQHERGAHARELTPSPSQPLDGSETGRGDVVSAFVRGGCRVGVVGRAQRVGHDLLPVGREVRAGVGHPASPPAEWTSTIPRARSPSARPARSAGRRRGG